MGRGNDGDECRLEDEFSPVAGFKLIVGTTGVGVGAAFSGCGTAIIVGILIIEEPLSGWASIDGACRITFCCRKVVGTGDCDGACTCGGTGA